MMICACGLVVGKAFTNLVINHGIVCEWPMNYFSCVTPMNKDSSVDLQSFTQVKQRHYLSLSNKNR